MKFCNYEAQFIVVIGFPFSDLSDAKKKPALIISNELVNNTGDYLMVQVTSKIRYDNLYLPINETDFVMGNELPLKSCIRLHKIFVLNEKLIISKKTAVNNAYLELVIEKIIELIR